MKRYSLVFLMLGATSVVSLAAASPTKAPNPTDRATSLCAPQGSLLHYYDLIPAKHFASFGGVNRRSLLKRPGAIVDYKRKFIQIPGSPKDGGDVQMLQISLLPNGNEPWIAVSRIVQARQKRIPGTLNFYYGYNDAGGLREAASDFFPYTLKRRGTDAFENAYLPRKGLTIEVGVAGVSLRSPKFTYDPKAGAKGNFFVRTG